jgi:hypothetical protein
MWRRRHITAASLKSRMNAAFRIQAIDRDKAEGLLGVLRIAPFYFLLKKFHLCHLNDQPCRSDVAIRLHPRPGVKGETNFSVTPRAKTQSEK